MAGGLNKCIFIGNLGRDPELRYTQRGTAVCQFTVAVNRPGGTDDNGQRREDQVEWVRCVAWEKLAETCSQYLTKGRQVYVEGRMQTRKWEGQDGGTRYSTEIVLSYMLMLGPNPNSQNGSNGHHDDVGGDWPDDDVAPATSRVNPSDVSF